jgi:hypothetical protein
MQETAWSMSLVGHHVDEVVVVGDGVATASVAACDLLA